MRVFIPQPTVISGAAIATACAAFVAQYPARLANRFRVGVTTRVRDGFGMAYIADVTAIEVRGDTVFVSGEWI
jgi:hypothetical protein